MLNNENLKNFYSTDVITNIKNKKKFELNLK